MIKRLWRNWCKKVEEHNAKQTYATYEECWEPTTIFVPFILGLIITLAANGITECWSWFTSFINYLISTAMMGIGLFLNWKIYD